MDGFQLSDGIFDQQAVGDCKAVFVKYGIDLVLQVEHSFKCLPGFEYLAEALRYTCA